MSAKFLVLALASVIVHAQAFAGNTDDGAFLDPRYKNIQHPAVSAPVAEGTLDDRGNAVASKSDTVALINQQSAIRSQAARGTCSIFSATAMLESMLIITQKSNPSVDLSEEWLEYVITSRSGSEGSSSNANFAAFAKYGTTEEQVLPYIGETWEDATSGLAQKRCADSSNKATCLIAHRDPKLLQASDAQLLQVGGALYDPEFQKARSTAQAFRAKTLAGLVQSFNVNSSDEAKSLLRQGVPVTMDIDFYYGAWNHREADNLGIDRNADHWSKGIVFYPERGSVDRAKSVTDPAGHSVLLVGYDDSVVVTKEVKMTDGTTKTFSHKGVYYFKNSWGTSSFGANFSVDGKNFPGYGMIVQDYVHEFGGFYKLPLK